MLTQRISYSVQSLQCPRTGLSLIPLSPLCALLILGPNPSHSLLDLLGRRLSGLILYRGQGPTDTANKTLAYHLLFSQYLTGFISQYLLSSFTNRNSRYPVTLRRKSWALESLFFAAPERTLHPYFQVS